MKNLLDMFNYFKGYNQKIETLDLIKIKSPRIKNRYLITGL